MRIGETAPSARVSSPSAKLSFGLCHAVPQPLNLAVEIDHLRHREAGTAQQRLGETSRPCVKIGALGGHCRATRRQVCRPAMR